MDSLIFGIFQFAILIFSVIIHEVSHGYAAERLGDPTARLAGRLTMNPIPHIDLFGSVILPLLFFLTNSPILLGWAKPVPYDPRNLRDQRYGPLKVALAGPGSNILLFLIFGLAARLGAGVALSPELIALFSLIALLNVSLAVLNLIPIPPLDGSKILFLFLPQRYVHMIERAGMGGIFLVLIFLMFFSWVIPTISGIGFYLVAGPEAIAALNSVF